jgi:hypothetical protein
VISISAPALVARPRGGGTCAFRALCGQMVLSWRGVRSRLVWGGMLYRAGPDEISDVVAYVGPGNAALWRVPGTGSIAHAWLEVGADLVDFSPGDWREKPALVLDNELDLLLNGVPLPPIQWTALPPDYFWQSKASLTDPWRPVRTPDLGQA